jgi:hypothetical protein
MPPGSSPWSATSPEPSGAGGLSLAASHATSP